MTVNDWEDASYMLGTLGAAIQIGLMVYQFFHERKQEHEPHGELMVGNAEDGTVQPLTAVLSDHEERLRRLERPRKPKRG